MHVFFEKVRDQSGYSAVEAMVVSLILVFVLVATYSLMDISYKMNGMAEDGFIAQSDGRTVITKITRFLRPAENMNVTGVPVLFASNDGTFIDVRTDINKDGTSEIVRFLLDQTNKQIKMYVDNKDESSGLFNFQVHDSDYQTYYSNPSNWDSVEAIASKVVNNPPTAWGAQSAVTSPETDKRLFTFYGENFNVPLDTRDTSVGGMGPIWVNHVQGVKIYLLNDIKPLSAPSPYAVQTNVNLRNISGD